MKTLKQIKAKLDKIHKEKIRVRDSDGQYAKCISCGKSVQLGTNDCHAGHYIAKSLSLFLRWNDFNVNVQCAGCNTFRHGNLIEYRKGLVDKYGEDIVDYLEDYRKEQVKFSRFELEEMLQENIDKLELLKKSKHLQ